MLDQSDKEFLTALVQNAVKNIRFPVGSKNSSNVGSAGTVTNASSVIVFDNDSRFLLLIQNTGSKDMYLTANTKATTDGFKIVAGGYYPLGRGTTFPYTGPIAAICAGSDSTTYSIIEINIEENFEV